MADRNWAEDSEEVDFGVLTGKTLKSIENRGEEIIFTTTEGEIYRQVHYDICCESCSVEEIHGDLQDLVGSTILMAEEAASTKEKTEVSETWTFYKAATIKGSVTIRWYGSSNGYYSESPTFEQVKKMINEVVVWKDGTWKPVEYSWEYQGDPDFLVAIPVDAMSLERSAEHHRKFDDEREKSRQERAR